MSETDGAGEPDPMLGSGMISKVASVTGEKVEDIE